MADRGFLGRGWAFPPEFDASTRAVRMVAGEEDIHESLRILFSTITGERVMRPDYGGGVEEHAFTPMDPSSVTMLIGVMRDAILRFEPRIVLDDIDVDTSREIDGVLAFRLTYRVVSTNTRSNVVYPFYFKEGTNVVGK
jgi:hypothetical protein